MTNLAHSSKDGHCSRRAVLPIVMKMMMMMMTGHRLGGEEKVVLMRILKK
jgi:hypothetical protein